MRLWDNFSLVVVLALVAGLVTGGPPGYTREISTVSLVFAMTFSLAEVRFRGLSARAELRGFVRALALNYGVLSGVILGLSFLYVDRDVRLGWVVMAAVPSAVAVIPITSMLRGNAQRALFSSAFLYVAALGIAPVLTLLFAGEAANPLDLGTQLFLLIALPMVVSRPLASSPVLAKHRRLFVNASFFVLVLTLAGANRSVFTTSPGLVAALAVGGLVRTWGIGAAIYVVTTLRSEDRALRVSDSLFACLKNLGLAAVLGASLFGPVAALPAIISMFLEISWVVVLGRWFS